MAVSEADPSDQTAPAAGADAIAAARRAAFHADGAARDAAARPPGAAEASLAERLAEAHPAAAAGAYSLAAEWAHLQDAAELSAAADALAGASEQAEALLRLAAGHDTPAPGPPAPPAETA